MPGFTADIALTKSTNYYWSIVSQIGSARGSTSGVQPAMKGTCVSDDGQSTCVCTRSCIAGTSTCSCT
jgi:hypothetical protein